jgi:phage gpG-like protein
MSTFKIQIETNAADVARATGAFRGVAAQAIAGALDRENQFTIGYISRTKLSQRGPKTLGVGQTNGGRLRGSLRASQARASGSEIESGIGTNVKYAAAHEFGTGPYVIRPKKGRFLRFGTPRGIVFARQVNHPGLPARAPIATGIEERSENYSAGIAKAVEEAWSK